MKESVTYQAIVEEGRVEGQVEGMLRARREDLLLLGGERFGPPAPENETALQSITDPRRLARMIGALRKASSWEDLLATP